MHQLGIEVAGPEDVTELRGRGERLVVLPEPQPGRYLAAGAPGRGDDPLGVPRQQVAIHPGLAEIAFQRRERGQLEEVVHALSGLREQRHVRVSAGAGDVVVLLGWCTPAHWLLVPAVLGRDVGLNADDRLDAGGLRLRPEVVSAVDVAVVGDRDRWHAGPLALAEQLLQACSP